MAGEKSGFKSNRPIVGPIETEGSCTSVATKSRGAHACYSSYVCGHSTTVSYIYILSMSTRYLTVDATSGGCTIHDYEKEVTTFVQLEWVYVYLRKLTSHRYKSQYTNTKTHVF